MSSQDNPDHVQEHRISQQERPSSQPALLPAFEPLSSSPGLPRPAKRKHDGTSVRGLADIQHYPTPQPTSSTALLPSSSPPPLPSTRPGLQRMLSTVSERAPLAAVPCVDLPINGEAVLMGRSSNSSHYQLSANRLISRVHVRALYRQARKPEESASVEIECVGWNGAKVHCGGQVFELDKGHTFSSDKPQAEIMLDVQDARVFVRWPSLHRASSVTALSDATWDDEASPRRAATPTRDRFASSPPISHVHLQSPVSPSPRERLAPTASSTFLGLPPSSPSRPSVQVYEDSPSADEAAAADLTSAAQPEPPPAVSMSKSSNASSSLSEPEGFSDQDEENDPIIHSFGASGDNILPRMASISAVSPERRRQPLKTSVSPRQRAAGGDSHINTDMSAVRNHVINQLAFSRLHALPLSTIMRNLPASLKHGIDGVGPSDGGDQPAKRMLTDGELKALLDETPCVGEIAREGKDAAGKALEDEFYYVPEMDEDEARRNAVENSLGKPGLRAVRKQHKQYFWKRPRH